MPKIETWDNLPAAVRHHLIERMRDRSIGIADLNQRPRIVSVGRPHSRATARSFPHRIVQ